MPDCLRGMNINDPPNANTLTTSKRNPFLEETQTEEGSDRIKIEERNKARPTLCSDTYLAVFGALGVTRNILKTPQLDLCGMNINDPPNANTLTTSKHIPF